MPVEIDNADGLLAGGFVLTYDANILKPLQTMSSSLLSGAYWKANMEKPGELRVAFASGNPLKGRGTLFSVEFETMPEIFQSETRLALTQVKLGKIHTVTVNNGNIVFLPKHTKLLTNYPNPFNPETWHTLDFAQTMFVLSPALTYRETFPVLGLSPIKRVTLVAKDLIVPIFCWHEAKNRLKFS